MWAGYNRRSKIVNGTFLVARFMLTCSQRQGGKSRTKLDKLQEFDGYKTKAKQKTEICYVPVGRNPFKFKCCSGALELQTY